MCGPVAQRLERPAHNRLVPGSNPGGPTQHDAMQIGIGVHRDLACSDLTRCPDLERLIQLQHLESTIAEARRHDRRASAAPRRRRRAARRGRRRPSRPPSSASRTTRTRAARSKRTPPSTRAASPSSRTSSRPSRPTANTPRCSTRSRPRRRDLGAAEEKVLERMMEADALAGRREAGGSRARRAAEGRSTPRRRSSTEELAARREPRSPRRPTARAALVKALEPRLLALFEQVAKVRKGVAICRAPRATACARSATCGCARRCSSRCARTTDHPVRQLPAHPLLRPAAPAAVEHARVRTQSAVNQPSLFGPPAAAPPSHNIDGGSRGNPGPAGYGVRIERRTAPSSS